MNDSYAHLNISSELYVKLYYKMLLIRHFEEKVVEVYKLQDMKTPVHLYIGEEAIASGVCVNLRNEDYIFTTHRSHGHFLAKGADPKVLFAEFYGRKTGCCKGKGGSMHLVAPEVGILGTSAIVAGGIPLAVGTALATQLRREDKVSVSFFGDGATEEGTFHESLNFAALKKLPVVFICENNFYATNSHIAVRQVNDNIAKKAESYDIPGIRINGNDVLEVYQTSKEAIERARRGEGPTLIECRTYRWKGHVGPQYDHENGCRSKHELEEWMGKCPIEFYKQYLFQNKIIDESESRNMVKEVDAYIESALQWAQESPFPEEKELFEDIYFERT